MRGWSRRESAPEEAPPAPRFLCRTCGTAGPFYVARNVTNWYTIADPYRTPEGTLTFGIYNTHLPGQLGPPLAHLCGNCRMQTETLEELVLEHALAVGE